MFCLGVFGKEGFCPGGFCPGGFCPRTEINMAHIIISLKGLETNCVTLTTKYFAQDHVLSV